MARLWPLLITILLLSIFIVAKPVQSHGNSIKASLQTKDLLKPLLVITNTGTESCQIINTSIGTVSITKATQNGKNITPLPIKVFLDDGMESFLEHNLKILEPNESVEIPLEIYPFKDSHAIQTITWSKLTGAYGQIYPLQKDVPYSLEVTYTSPLSSDGIVHMCGTAIAISENPSLFDTLLQYKRVIIIGIVLLLLILLIIYFLRSKKHKKTAVTAVFIFLLLSGMARPAQADFSVPSSDAGLFDNCMAIFDRYPDITGDILDRVAEGDIQIFTNRSSVNDATDWPDGSYHVRWDPESEYDYHSDGDNPVSSSPCDRLFHELYHVYEIMNRTISREDCGGVPQAEVNATRAQNRLREAMGLPPRTHYGHDRLPTGDGCEDEEPPPPPSPGCGFSCSTSWGEPHLKTFDGKSYDFQAVGEFVGAADPKGDLEVQVRQQPWSTSRYVSMNTAVAMKVGTEKVELQLHDSEFGLLINGKREPFKTKELAGGGSVTTLNNNHAVVTWPDNTRVTVNFYSTFGLDLFIELSETRKGSVSGIFGNFNGEAGDDLVIRGANQTIEADFELLYPKFADSWRVDAKSSLFTYENGSNTNSYTDKTFPEKYISPNDLPNKAFAETVCKDMGVTDKILLQNCILDVGLTGRPEFAYAAGKVQEALTTKVKNYGEKSWDIRIVQPGAAQHVTFEGKANEKVFIDLTQSTLPAQCGNLRLLKSERELLAEGCVVSGEGIIDSTTLPADGTYTISVSTLPLTTGSGLLQLVKVTDQLETITPGGKPVVVKIDKPGKNAELSFEGEVGQIYTVNISKATLPAQCGGYGVEAQDGASMGSSCLLQSATFDTIKLPATGIYKIVLDPTGRAMGEATVEIKKKV
jgi:hypothetical protein